MYVCYLWYFHGRRLPRLVGNPPVLEALFFDFSLPDFVQGGVPGKGDDLGQSHDLPLAQGLVGAAHVLPEGAVVTHHLQRDDVRDVTARLGQTQLGEAECVQLTVHLEPAEMGQIHVNLMQIESFNSFSTFRAVA